MTATSPKWNELVFEHRNKSYGAFELRNQYNFTLNKSVFYSTCLFVAFIGSIWLNLWIEQLMSNPVSVIENSQEKSKTKSSNTKEIDNKVQEIELPSIYTFKIWEDKKLEKYLADKELDELTKKYEIYDGGIIKYSIDPKTGKQYTPKSNAEFPGGAKEFTKHLLNQISFNQTTENKNYHYANGDDEIEYEINTLVFVKCEIDETGNLTHVELVKGASDPKFNDRILEAFKKSPKWKAAAHEGKRVKETLIIPFHFYYMQPLIKYYTF